MSTRGRYDFATRAEGRYLPVFARRRVNQHRGSSSIWMFMRSMTGRRIHHSILIIGPREREVEIAITSKEMLINLVRVGVEDVVRGGRVWCSGTR
jgi:hypothetical protein